MAYISKIDVKGKGVLGVRVEIPSAPPLLILVGTKGLVACRYFNMVVAEESGIAAAMVSGVKSFNDVLKAKILFANHKARKLGVKAGMNGSEALRILA